MENAGPSPENCQNVAEKTAGKWPGSRQKVPSKLLDSRRTVDGVAGKRDHAENLRLTELYRVVVKPFELDSKESRKNQLKPEGLLASLGITKVGKRTAR